MKLSTGPRKRFLFGSVESLMACEPKGPRFSFKFRENKLAQRVPKTPLNKINISSLAPIPMISMEIETVVKI